MRGGSHSTYTQNPERQKANREHIAQLGDYNLFRAFVETNHDPTTLDKIAAIATYQSGTPVEQLVRRPLPAAITDEDRAYFTHNTSLYSDEVEDALDDDAVMRELTKLPATDERMMAIRARRSLLVLQLLATEQVCFSPDHNGGKLRVLEEVA